MIGSNAALEVTPSSDAHHDIVCCRVLQVDHGRFCLDPEMHDMNIHISVLRHITTLSAAGFLKKTADTPV